MIRSGAQSKTSEGIRVRGLIPLHTIIPNIALLAPIESLPYIRYSRVYLQLLVAMFISETYTVPLCLIL